MTYADKERASPTGLLTWYPTVPEETDTDKDGYKWSVIASHSPVLAPKNHRELAGRCYVDDTLHQGPESQAAIWVGTGVRGVDHPAKGVTYSDGQNFCETCLLCNSDSRTTIVYARILQWKSSYSLGHYEYLQEYELRCEKCAFSGGKADRYTARYKLFTAGMDPHGSAFFKVDANRNIVAAPGQELVNPFMFVPNSGGRTSAPKCQPRKPGESGARNKCLADGCKRNTIKSTNYCKLHEHLQAAEDAATGYVG